MDNVAVGGLSAVTERSKFLTKVYAWMVLGLLVSALGSFLPYISPSMALLVTKGYIGLIVAELALVFIITLGIKKMSPIAAGLCFVLYALVNGLTLFSIYLVYTGGSIINVFLICACTFAAVSILGATTKRDLTSLAHYLSMALIGIVIACVINYFARSRVLDYIVSIVGVLVFTGLTAYDTQKILSIASGADGRAVYNKVAIIGALNLYLDFINLFLQLLRLFGRRRD